ncbi:unnamed protein product [Microthlaspi erraticum]|uniref:Shugoshin C-terminal domain-containing protein n=1 Tax=Microthlaspi erraticum TaxID=1685480 RepID=A0A6D2L591_9BRAS|nr:unnamed protein product [Microthlaspi erraticum]
MVRATDLKFADHAVEGVPPTNKAQGVKMVLEPPMNSAQRRKLGDITNLQNQNILMNQEAYQQLQSFAEKLQKENMRLMKILKERNEIIERSGIELQKYRINMQKVQEQNLQLAQTNTRILAENNTTKDQLKALQHELGCKNGLLMARKLLLEAQDPPCTCRHTSEDKDYGNTSGVACESFPPNGKDLKTASESSNVSSLQVNEKANNKRRVSGRTNPPGSKVLDIIGGIGEIIETANKRRVSLRRQSAKFNIQELGVTENLNDDQEIAANARCSASDQSKPEAVEPQGTKEITGKTRASSRNRTAEVETQGAIKESEDHPLHDDIVEESSQISASVSMELEGEPKNKSRGDEAEVVRRTSVGRPSRKAAEKIKSYKEPSLKEKMRG